jgi:hypothetical protein
MAITAREYRSREEGTCCLRSPSFVVHCCSLRPPIPPILPGTRPVVSTPGWILGQTPHQIGGWLSLLHLAVRSAEPKRCPRSTAPWTRRNAKKRKTLHPNARSGLCEKRIIVSICFCAQIEFSFFCFTHFAEQEVALPDAASGTPTKRPSSGTSIATRSGSTIHQLERGRHQLG